MNGRATAYARVRFFCKLPVTDAAALAERMTITDIACPRARSWTSRPLSVAGQGEGSAIDAKESPLGTRN